MHSVRRSERLCRRKPTFIERASDHHTFDIRLTECNEGFDVFWAAYAARGNDRNRERAGEFGCSAEVHTAEDAIALNVGEEDGRDAGILEAFAELDGGHVRYLGPAARCDLSVPGIRANHNASRKQPRGFTDESRICECSRS